MPRKTKSIKKKASGKVSKKVSKKFSEKDYNKFRKDSALPGYEKKFLNEEHKDMIKCMTNKCGYDILKVNTDIKKCLQIQDENKTDKCMLKLNKKLIPIMKCSNKKCKSKQEKYGKSVKKIVEADRKQSLKMTKKSKPVRKAKKTLKSKNKSKF